VLFLTVPLLEIYVLIEVGARIGAATTVAIIIATAAGGAILLRQQGFATLRRAQTSLHAHRLPALELVEAVILLICGLLLLTPGFLTDVLGALILIAPLRRVLARLLLRRVLARSTVVRTNEPFTIETDFWHEKDRDE